MSSFYSAKWGNILLYISDNSDIRRRPTCTTMVTYTEAWNIAFETSKPFWKIWKYKINIYPEEYKFKGRKKNPQ